MAAPVVDTAQSCPGGKQFHPIGFQPWATNAPESWECSTLPPGLTINPISGLISGTPTLPGVYNFSVRATNADGTSLPVVFTIGIEESSLPVPSSALDTRIDLATRLVKFEGADQLWIKRGDDLFFYVRFERGGLACDLDITTFKIAIKLDETEPDPLVFGSGFIKVGTGENTVYLVHCRANSDALAGAFDDPTGDATAKIEDRIANFRGLAEFEWTENNTLGVGTAHLRSTSRTFFVQNARDLIADATPTS